MIEFPVSGFRKSGVEMETLLGSSFVKDENISDKEGCGREEE